MRRAIRARIEGKLGELIGGFVGFRRKFEIAADDPVIAQKIKAIGRSHRLWSGPVRRRQFGIPVNEPRAIPNLEPLIVALAFLKQRARLLDQGFVGSVFERFHRSNMSAAKKVTAHWSLPPNPGGHPGSRVYRRTPPGTSCGCNIEVTARFARKAKSVSNRTDLAVDNLWRGERDGKR